MLFPLIYPVEAAKHKNWGVNAFMERHRKDPFLSSVTLEADSAQARSGTAQGPRLRSFVLLLAA